MKQQSITSLPLSPEQERRARMIKYTIAMGIRMVCIVLMLFVQGWWLLVCAIGAIALPYFAVVFANVQGGAAASAIVRPGAVQLYRGPNDGPSNGPTSGSNRGSTSGSNNDESGT